MKGDEAKMSTIEVSNMEEKGDNGNGEENGRSQTAPERVSVRVSALLQLIATVTVIAAALAIVVIEDVNNLRKCRAIREAIVIGTLVLSILRCLVILISGYLQYKAGMSAINEARVAMYQSEDGADTSMQTAKGNAYAQAKGWTQRSYDRLLLWHAILEPFFFLIQLGFGIAELIEFVPHSHKCIETYSEKSRRAMLGLYITMAIMNWIFIGIRMSFGARVLSWRGLFGFEKESWERHYEENIEHIIRVFMCCLLQQPKYFFVKEAVRGRSAHPVALGLAKLFDFRAYGTGTMLEFLRALEHIRRIDTKRAKEAREIQLSATPPLSSLNDRTRKLILEATTLVRFSTAAYTGITLDMLRLLKFKNPFFILRRQELFRVMFKKDEATLESPKSDDESSSRSLKSAVKGENLWGGNTRAFARYARISFNDVLGGRIGSEAKNVRPQGMSSVSGLLSYFVVKVPDAKIILISIRGTADIEDLILDVNAFEGSVKHEDLGLNPPSDKKIRSGDCGWAHFGVLEATREMYMELMGDDQSSGLLPQTMADPEYADWPLRVVGQSLGAAVAGLLTLRLRKSYPCIHAYCYNPWPVCSEGVVQSVGENTVCSIITNLCYNEDVVSRLTFPTVCGVQDRVCKEIISIQKDPWRGQSIGPCCPEMRAICGTCSFACSKLCYCMMHVNDNLDAVMDKHGRCVSTPRYMVCPEESEEYYRKARELDIEQVAKGSKRMLSAWAPVAMRMDRDGGYIRAHSDASASIRRTSKAEYTTRWNSLKDVDLNASDDHVMIQFSGQRFILIGEILHFKSCKDKSDQSTWYVSPADAQDFQELLLCDNMLTDHMPWHLEAALHFVAAKIEKE